MSGRKLDVGNAIDQGVLNAVKGGDSCKGRRVFFFRNPSCAGTGNGRYRPPKDFNLEAGG